MVASNYHWSSERATLKRASGVYGVDAIDMLASKVDALAQRFDRLGTPSESQIGSSSGAMFEIGALCQMCGLQGHVVAECHSMYRELSMPMPCKTSTLPHRTTPYSNTYNPGWRNRPNFSYRNNKPLSPNALQP